MIRGKYSESQTIIWTGHTQTIRTWSLVGTQCSQRHDNMTKRTASSSDTPSSLLSPQASDSQWSSLHEGDHWMDTRGYGNGMHRHTLLCQLNAVSIRSREWMCLWYWHLMHGPHRASRQHIQALWLHHWSYKPAGESWLGNAALVRGTVSRAQCSK